MTDTSSDKCPYKVHHLDDQSLAHLVSSPERFAASHNMTIHQVQAAIEARRQASLDLHHELQALGNIAFTGSDIDRATIGRMKHQMICRSRYVHQRSPFVCRTCWTHKPICICSLFHRKIPLPDGVRCVYVWTHHEEWGKTANTGSMLPLGLENVQMLMKGLEEHDSLFRREVLDERPESSVIPVVLWPGKGGDNQTITLPQLRQMLHSETKAPSNNATKKEIALVAIEGTWGNARKMANKLPPHILRLDIGDEISTFYSNNNHESYSDNQPSSLRTTLPKPKALSPSLLAPLRRQGKGKEGGSTNVSTLEATIITLLALGMGKVDGRWMLSNAKNKIDRIREFTGKVYARS